MRILIDGDACPQKEDILNIAHKYNIKVILYIDYSHQINEEYYKVIYCDIDRDSVDSKIINDAKRNDIIITQDYGLAGYVLTKHTLVLTPSGIIINNDNIDSLLNSRYTYSKLRKHHKHIKGPSKRNNQIKEYFIKQLEYLILNNGG